MRLGDRGLELIKSYESLRLSAYLPTLDDVPTIGYGHTKGVKLGDTCTKDQAERWLAEDTAHAVATVNAFIDTLPERVTQSMFDALVSLVYNVGPTPVSVRSIIGRSLIDKDYYVAWRSFALWINQSGSPLLGLARRRAAEMVLFLADGLPRS